ncbi:MAG TPA: efflux RND transporter periplasmic adaptor subunit [Pseudomonadota bacterium]|nr:efflux RND transporter periplasmic adaptor subunit [Rhodanobacteraceae bacterium]MBP9155924.1 efflux RND transporter periplasmic adaptor subunit [Xanthomonadales bacterium]HQW82579.1 efflux RND transporter periplasmic adaptor subunit [Pseudomonadota bacterium]
MRKLLLSIAIAIVLGAGLSACSQSAAESAASAEADAALAVETVQIKRGDMVRVFSGTATLAAERAANLVSENGGEVLNIYVEEGDRVAAGQVLARIDGERARLALAQTTSIAKRLDHEAQRASLLLDKHMIAADAVERAGFERDAQRAAVALAALSLGKSEIRAPYAGVITRRHIKSGQWLSPNGLAFEIADFDDLVADVPVPEKELAGLRTGQPVAVTADAFRGGEFLGQVERIGAIVDAASGTANVRISIDEADTPLRPGQFVRIAIERERIADALLLPKSALMMGGRQPEVFTVAQGKAHRQPVVLGGEQDGWVQLLGGLAEGAHVVQLGQSQLSDGDAVTIVNRAATTIAREILRSTP